MDVLELMKTRLAEAESDAQRLRDAIAALERDDPESAPNRARRRQAPHDRSRAAVPLAKILKAVEDEPGLTTTALAKRLDGDQSQVLTLLKEAEQDGKVTRDGERRGTKWFLTNG